MQNNLAWHHKTTLSIPLKSNGQLYFESNEQKSDQEKSKVTVTIENKDDANNYTRIYHIKFADPTVQYDSDASLSFLTVGIPNYTIPDNVHSFDEDWKTFKAQGNLGFGGDNAITGNSQVLNDVINTPGIYYKQEKVDSSGKRTQLGFAARYNWMFSISESPSALSTANSANAYELRRVILHFRDTANPSVDLPNTQLIDQGSTGSNIQFDGDQAILNNLINNDNYVLDRVSTLNGDKNITGTNQQDLTTYNWGTFSNNNASEFVVYVKKAQAQFNIHYIDVGRTNKTSGFTPSDGTPIIGHDINNIGGSLGSTYNVKSSLWPAGGENGYEKVGYELASEPSNIGQGTISANMTDQYIYLKHQLTKNIKAKPVTINETIHYRYINGSEAYSDFNAPGIIFTPSGNHDEVTGVDFDLTWTPKNDQSFAAKKITIPSGYKVLSVKDQDGTNQLGQETDGQYVQAINGINHNSHDVNITVIYGRPEQASYNIHYIDVTGKTLPAGRTAWQPSDGTQLTAHEVTGLSGNVGDTPDFSNRLWNYTKANYILVSNPAGAALGKAKLTAGMADQYVYLKDGTNSKITTQPVTINETIHYKYSDGSQAYPDFKAAGITFTPIGEHDEVTGKDVNVTWTPKGDQSFAAKKITIPSGYKVLSVKDQNGTNQLSQGTDGQYVKAFNGINHNSHDVEITVIYEQITKPVEPTQTVNDDKTVIETIHYVYSDGTKAANDKVQTANFHRTGTKDLKTNVTTWNAWAPETATIAAVDSPIIDGYSASVAQIAAQAVNANSSNLNFTVIYTAKSKPVTPVNPSNPSRPSQPSQPSEPSQPTKPSTPSQPSQPSKPSQPTKPSTPSQPSQPSEPVQPSQPSTPLNPDNPGSNNSSDKLHHHESGQPEQPGANNENGSNPGQPSQQPNGEGQSEGLNRTSTTVVGKNGLKLNQGNASKTQGQRQASLPQTGNDRATAALAGAGLISALGAMLLGKKRKQD